MDDLDLYADFAVRCTVRDVRAEFISESENLFDDSEHLREVEMLELLRSE